MPKPGRGRTPKSRGGDKKREKPGWADKGGRKGRGSPKKR